MKFYVPGWVREVNHYRPVGGDAWVRYPWKWGVHRCPCGCCRGVLVTLGGRSFLVPRVRVQWPVRLEWW